MDTQVRKKESKVKNNKWWRQEQIEEWISCVTEFPLLQPQTCFKDPNLWGGNTEEA